MKTTYSWYSYAERKRRWDVFGARDEQAQEMRSFPKIREAKIENRISKQIGLPHRLQFHNRKRKYRVPARRDVIIESQTHVYKGIPKAREKQLGCLPMKETTVQCLN
ncbi:hypothetical protein PV325_013883 [Microctonus aethiopoides]|nr:hypothetical protein PV325_013883 [Microctonus aethiopoides]